MAKKKELLLEEKVSTKEVDLDKIKNELTEYVDQKIQKIVDDKVKKETINEIERVNRKLIREKNKKILGKNILIIILLAIIGGLLYLLYDNNYFDKYFNKDNKKVEEKTTKKETTKKEEKKEPEKEKKPTLDDLIKEHGYLINTVSISEKSDYLKDYYNGNLTDDVKNYLALNMIDFSTLQEDDGCNIIDPDILKEKYEKLFTTDYQSKTFKYDGNTVRYLSKIDSYITDSKLDKVSSNIKREITSIVVEDEQVKITTIEGIVKDDKVFNIIDNEELGTYKDSLKSYKDKLNTITYVFKGEKLISIEK